MVGSDRRVCCRARHCHFTMSSLAPDVAPAPPLGKDRTCRIRLVSSFGFAPPRCPSFWQWQRGHTSAPACWHAAGAGRDCQRAHADTPTGARNGARFRLLARARGAGRAVSDSAASKCPDMPAARVDAGSALDGLVCRPTARRQDHTSPPRGAVLARVPSAR